VWNRPVAQILQAAFSSLAQHAPPVLPKPAVRRFATWIPPDGRQGDICCGCAAGAVETRFEPSRWSLDLHAATPTASGLLGVLMMMAFPSRQHALEMNCGPYAGWAFFYWAARGG
jgi:hypothetical protein